MWKEIYMLAFTRLNYAIPSHILAPLFVERRARIHNWGLILTENCRLQLSANEGWKNMLKKNEMTTYHPSLTEGPRRWLDSLAYYWYFCILLVECLIVKHNQTGEIHCIKYKTCMKFLHELKVVEILVNEWWYSEYEIFVIQGLVRIFVSHWWCCGKVFNKDKPSVFTFLNLLDSSFENE